MNLLTLQIFPKGLDGWMSDELHFGNHITQLFGPNGCGKTPLVQSISYCLGYPSIFRHDIYDKCSYVILKISVDKGEYYLKRYFEKEQLYIEVTEPTGTTQTFFDEATYSEFIFELININSRKLVTIDSKPTQPYISTFLPIFYLDQDDGYSKIYYSSKNFIRDQFPEMLRLSLALPAKNSVDEKRAKKIAKDKLDELDRIVHNLEQQIQKRRLDAVHITETPEQIGLKINSLKSELDRLKETNNDYNEVSNAYDQMITDIRTELRNIDNKILEINKRDASIRKIIDDINTEIETLSLNEGAKRIFTSFDEICSSGDCQLFSRSSNSYSKNLLYLKDQIKDLERNSSLESIVLEQLKKSKIHNETLLKSIIDKRNESIDKSDISIVVDIISSIKDQIFENQNDKSEVEHIISLENTLFEKIIARNLAINEYKNLNSTRSVPPELLKIKIKLKELFIKWLDAIHTTNINKDISWVDDFTPKLGSENIVNLKGSTRIRAVLAYHAALFELLVSKSFPVLKFMILDTPKQHDIEYNDLDKYMISLKELARRYNIQIVFSSTEYHYQGDSFDAEWTPKYPGEDHLMFLKKEN